MQKQKSVRARKKRRMSYNAKTRLWLVLCYPVGLTRMWRSRCSWKLGTKYLISSIALVVLAAALVLWFKLYGRDRRYGKSNKGYRQHAYRGRRR